MKRTIRIPRREVKCLGHRIRDLRKQRGLRQKEVAAAIATDEGTLSRIENGKREPSLAQLRLLAQKFGVQPGDLLSGAVHS